jgi:hypothetical protein
MVRVDHQYHKYSQQASKSACMCRAYAFWVRLIRDGSLTKCYEELVVMAVV